MEIDEANFCHYFNDHKQVKTKRLVLVVVQLAALFSVSACKVSNEVSKSDALIAAAEPLESNARTFEQVRDVKAGEIDFVPEEVMQEAIAQLRSWGKEGQVLSDGLFDCSAIRAFRANGKPSSCFGDNGDEESSAACLAKRGYGKKSIGQALSANKVDLNGDGKLDFMLSDRYYCRELSANQAQVYLVLLSQPSGSYKLSYAGWASYGLEVVLDPTTKSPVLVEKAVKSYGAFTRIMHLVDGRYVPRICLVQDEKGLRKCE